MAGRIPEMQRRKLASSAVGIVGADTSPAKALYHVAGVMDKVDTQNRNQEAKKQKAQAKQDAKIQDALSDSRTSLRTLEFQTKLDGLEADSPEHYNALAAALLDEQASGYEEGIDQSKFLEEGADLVFKSGTAYSKKFRKDSIKGVVNNTNQYVGEVANNISDLMGGKTPPVDSFSTEEPKAPLDLADKIQGFNSFVAAGQKGLDKASSAFGVDFQEFSKETHKRWLRAAVDGLLSTGSVNVGKDVDAFLTAVDAGNIIDPDELTELREDATKMAKARTNVAEATNAEAQRHAADKVKDMLLNDKYISKDQMDTMVIENLASEADVKGWKDFQESSTKTFRQDNPRKAAEIMTEFNSLFSKEHKVMGVAITSDEFELKDGVNFERLAAFRQHVMESAAAGGGKGGISLKTYEAYMGLIKPKFEETLAESFEEINKVSVAIKGAWIFDEEVNVVQNTEEDKLAKEAAQARLGLELMQNIDTQELRFKRRLEVPELRKLVNRTKTSFIHHLNKNRNRVELGEVVIARRGVHAGTRCKVVGIDPSGEPVLDTDLTAVPYIDDEKIYDKFDVANKGIPYAPKGKK